MICYLSDIMSVHVIRGHAKRNVPNGVFQIIESSRPGESHPQALTESYVTLSCHTALHVHPL
jgi:hypothetical protein